MDAWQSILMAGLAARPSARRARPRLPPH